MIRIRGIVRAAQKAQNSLKVGIAPHDVASFKQFITGSVETIERLCADAKITPSQLPTQSRSAYHFLKSINLNNLPVAEREIQEMEQTLRLKNIKTQQRTILQRISSLILSPTPNAAQIQELSKILVEAVTGIEQICASSKATPATLAGSSRSIYTWMKFLTDERNLQLHLDATHRARQIALEVLGAYQRQEPIDVVVEFTHFARLYKSRCSDAAATIIISEGFINASEEVLRSLVTAALQGKSPHTTQVIKNFASSEEYSNVLLELDLITEVIAENALGNCYDLDRLFDKVNREYFASTLVKPRLTWSKINTYRKFGHYEPARDRVVMSLTLDDARIPEFVVEFVLYHELLHKYHGAKWVNGRRMVHTPEFRRDERQFKLYEPADVWLKKLASGQSALAIGDQN